MNKRKKDVLLAWAVMTILCLGFWYYLLTRLIQNQ